MSYQYWVIRYVPNIARGEFTNIGIVAGVDGGDWAARFELRGVKIAGELRSDLRELHTWGRWFQSRIESHSNPGFGGVEIDTSWLEHLRERQANSVQLSEATPIVASSAAKALDLLFPLLVEREIPRRARRALTRVSMRSELRDAYLFERDFTNGRDLFVHPTARVGRQRGSFDLGRDETQAVVLTNAWAFNVATLDDLERDAQSWNYLMTRFRADGAEVNFDGQTRFLAGDEAVEVVYDPPTNERDASWRSDIYEAALEAWALNGIVATDYQSYLAQIRGSDQPALIW